VAASATRRLAATGGEHVGRIARAGLRTDGSLGGRYVGRIARAGLPRRDRWRARRTERSADGRDGSLRARPGSLPALRRGGAAPPSGPARARQHRRAAAQGRLARHRSFAPTLNHGSAAPALGGGVSGRSAMVPAPWGRPRRGFRRP
jgi:hypothetical protein